MFEITYKGANCVSISTKKSTLVSDPNLALVGLKNPTLKDAVELVTEERLSVADDTAKLVIDSPGEYEIGDFSIMGTSATRHIDTEDAQQVSTMYRITIGDVRIALFGNIAPKLTEEQLEFIGVVDVLMLPVGGAGYTLDATSAVTIARQIEPKAVIPLHYADSDLKYEVPQDVLSTFTEELGSPVEVVEKYKVKSSAALPPALTVVQVTRS